MQWAKLVSELIQEYEPQHILDLKARKWYFSILAASYWAKVDVLDDIDNAEFPDYLKNHPNITYYKGKVEDFVFKEKYDLIVVKHIVMYYPKEFILGKLMNDMYDHLNRNGICFITYHLPDSYTMKNNTWLYQYELDDFKWLKWKFVLKDFWNYTNSVSGEINKEHHVEYVVLVKQ